MEKHEFIAAEDRDTPIIFAKLCQLATVDLFKWASETNAAPENPFADDTDKLMRQPEAMLETYLDNMFGYESRLDNEPWLEATSKKTKWLFSADDVRKAVFASANITYQV